MATIADLPNELLLPILEQAAEGQSPCLILQIVRVSKIFAKIAEPLVYRRINLDSDDSDDLSVSLLTKSLLIDMDRAAYIRSIALGSNLDTMLTHERPKTEANPLNKLNRFERDCVKQMIDQTFRGEAEGDVEKRTRWQEECLERRSAFYLFALVFPRMSKLGNLVIRDMSAGAWRVIEEGIDGCAKHARVTGQPLPFTWLETVSIIQKQTRDPHSIPQLDIILKWPGVQHLFMSLAAEMPQTYNEGQLGPYLVLEPRSKPLKTITFDQMEISGEHLFHLLGSARALETFECGYQSVGGWGPELKVSELSRAMLQQAHSLRTITLDRRGLQMPWNDGEPELLDFSCFRQLKQLTICGRLLFTQSSGAVLEPKAASNYIANTLPESLEELSIIVCDSVEEGEAASASLQSLMQDSERKLVVLKEFKWECYRWGLAAPILWRDRQILHELARQKKVGLITWIEADFWDYEDGTAGSEIEWRVATVRE